MEKILRFGSAPVGGSARIALATGTKEKRALDIPPDLSKRAFSKATGLRLLD
jgi:hypothetical protein